MRDESNQEDAASRRHLCRLGTCRASIEEPRRVEKHLGVQLCPNPEWDMRLHLYQAELEGFAVYQSAICTVANIPSSSSPRWTIKLALRKILACRRDSRDKRRIVVGLVPPVREAPDHIRDGASATAIELIRRCESDPDAI